jgi:hypothetical protein
MDDSNNAKYTTPQPGSHRIIHLKAEKTVQEARDNDYR